MIGTELAGADVSFTGGQGVFCGRGGGQNVSTKDRSVLLKKEPKGPMRRIDVSEPQPNGCFRGNNDLVNNTSFTISFSLILMSINPTPRH